MKDRDDFFYFFAVDKSETILFGGEFRRDTLRLEYSIGSLKDQEEKQVILQAQSCRIVR